MSELLTKQEAAYVPIRIASAMTGLTEKAIESKIEKGAWVEGSEYRRSPDGVVEISMDGFAKWVERGIGAVRPTIDRTPSAPPTPVPTDLYRHFDVAGNLLYVGISFSAINRFSQHKYGSEWSKKVSKITIEKYESREDALIAEAQAIHKEKPKFNIAGTTRPPKVYKSVTIKERKATDLRATFAKLGITLKDQNGRPYE